MSKLNQTNTSKDMILNNKVDVVSQPSMDEYPTVHLPDIGSKEESDLISQLKEVEAGTSDTDDALKAGFEESKEATAEQAPITKKEKVTERVRSGQVSVSMIDPKDLDDFMAECWVARPLRQSNMLDVRSKDPNYRLRWVEFKSQGGANYNDRVAMGFSKAQKEDCVGLSSDVMITNDGIRHHDAILMKIPTATINGWLKHNALRSAALAQRGGALKAANAAANKELTNAVNNLSHDESHGHDMDSIRAKYGEHAFEIYTPGAEGVRFRER